MSQDKSYYREITLKHKFFKTQKHFINFTTKLLKDKKINHEFFTKQNIALLAWCLSKSSLLKRDGIDIPIDQLTWKISKEEDITELADNLQSILVELKDLFKNKITISECVKCREIFPFYNEDELFELKLYSQNYSEEFIDLIAELEKVPGVYFLYDLNKALIYIGKSYGIGRRVKSSISERKAFYCEIMIVENESEANILEPYYISLLKPVLNGDLVTLSKPNFTIDHKYKRSEMVQIFK